MTKKLTEAEKAYRAALREIKKLRIAGGTDLILKGKKFWALDRIPNEISSIANLQYLDLAVTNVADLSPIAEMTGLRKLHLNRTRITDLTALSSMKHLDMLLIDGTRIKDISPIKGLPALSSLSLDETRYLTLLTLQS